MFRPILETVRLRRPMPTQFPLKRSSRDASSTGDIPAVVSDVLRPKVLAFLDCVRNVFLKSKLGLMLLGL